MRKKKKTNPMRKNMKNKKEQKEPEIRRLKVMRAPVHPIVAHTELKKMNKS